MLGPCGTLLKRLSNDAMTITVTSYAGQLRLAHHTHVKPFLSVLVKGDYTEVQADDTHWCPPGTTIFHPAGEEHTDYFHCGGSCVNYEIEPGFATYLEQRGFPVNRRFVGKRSAEPFLAGLLKSDERFDEANLCALFLRLVPDRLTQGRVQPGWLRQAIDSIYGRIGNVSTSRLAEAAGVHPTYLAESFVRHVGTTPHELRLKMRFEQAARMLRKSRLPLKAIAAECGYCDQSHLTREVRRFAAMTPASYRGIFAE